MTIDVDTSGMAVVADRCLVLADEASGLALRLSSTWWLPPTSASTIAVPYVTAGALAAATLGPSLAVVAIGIASYATGLAAAAVLYEAAEDAANAAIAAVEAAVAVAVEVGEVIGEAAVAAWEWTVETGTAVATAVVETVVLVGTEIVEGAIVVGQWVVDTALVTGAIVGEAVTTALNAAESVILWAVGRYIPLLVFSPGVVAAVGVVALGAAAVLGTAQFVSFLWHAAHGRQAPDLFAETLELVFQHVNLQPLLRAGIDYAGAVLSPLPPVVLEALGLPADGAAGPAGAAYALALAAGLLRPGTFTVASLTTTPARRPDGTPAGAPPTLATMIAAVPPASEDTPQVSVTVYEAPGQPPIYAISVTGTSTFAFDSDEPLNGQGNLGTYGNSDAETVAAVLAAIEAAGVPAGAAVTLTGYSQGALAAQAVVASGRYDVQCLTTFGTPARPVGLPDDVPVFELEHDNDIVVGLQGSRPDGDDGATVAVAPGPEGSSSTEAHGHDGYLQTALDLGDPEHPEYSEQVAAMNDTYASIFEGYTEGQTTSVRVDRADGEAPAGSLPWLADQVADDPVTVGAPPWP